MKGRRQTVDRAFEEVVSEHLDALYRTALRLCGGREADAEDLLQDAMLRAFHGFGTLRDGGAARSWLFTILVRTNLNRVRSIRRRSELLSTELEGNDFEAALADWSPAPSPEQVVIDAQLRERITAALDELDEPLRSAVVLVDIEGFQQREVAAMLDIPEGTVASRLFRARRALRDLLRDMVDRRRMEKRS